MKIIGVDNLARDHVADILWLEGLPNTEEVKLCLKQVCGRLNRDLGDGGGTYYKVVEDEYKLSRGMEDLV